MGIQGGGRAIVQPVGDFDPLNSSEIESMIAECAFAIPQRSTFFSVSTRRWVPAGSASLRPPTGYREGFFSLLGLAEVIPIAETFEEIGESA